MLTIKIIDDIFLNEAETIVTDQNLVDFLATRYETFPDGGRIYRDVVSVETEITPCDADSAAALRNLADCTVWVVVTPLAPVAAFIVAYGGYIAMAVAVIAAAVVMRQAKQVPNTAALNQTQRSGNNELSDRSNKARPWGRIPDIYGEVISVPDLICQPYKIYINQVEREFALMCVGRGSYFIQDLSDIKDDTTPIQEIQGSSVEVFAPGDLVNPQYRIGDPITQQFYNLKRSNAVNGQVLKPLERANYDGQNGIEVAPGGWLSIPTEPKTMLGLAFATNKPRVINQGMRAGDKVRLRYQSLGLERIPSDRVDIGVSVDAISFYGQEADLTEIKKLQVGQKFYVDSKFVSREEYGKAYYSVVSGVFTVKAIEPIYGRKSNQFWLQQNAFLGFKITTVQPVKIGDGGVTDSNLKRGIHVDIMRATHDLELSGRYVVEKVEANRVKLSAPDTVNPNWHKVDKNYQSTGNVSLTLENPDRIGPFVCDYAQTTVLIANVVALSGLYKRDNDGEQAIDVRVRINADQIDMQGNYTGNSYSQEDLVRGATNWQGTRGLSLRLDLPSGRYKVSMERLTPTDKGFRGSVVDEIKWRDLYYGSELELGNLGDVTIVKSITNGTDGALAIKNRKLNMRVTRKLPKRIGATEFSQELYPTQSADDIFCAICLDPKNGNRDIEELDVENIYSVMEEIRRYFGVREAAHFNYTFDNNNTSFEEMIRMVADAAFCVAYRVGDKIKITPDIDAKLPVMIFNHRNKLPGTEKRTVNFGIDGDYDGIQYKYIDPFDGSQIMYSVPQGASKYKTVNSAGIANHKQAYLHAWRMYNMMKYKRISCQFTALSEADLLAVMDKIAVTDNTRLQYSEGEVLKQDGLKVWLSGKVKAKVGNYIFFQHWNRTTESIRIAAVDGNTITLASAPALPLAADDANYVNSMYFIEESDKVALSKQFLLMEKRPRSNMQVEVSCVNYDSRYYANDFDYANGNNPYDGN